MSSNGDSQTAKLANQIIVALNIEAVGEAPLFADRTDAYLARVREALTGFRIALHQKDLNLALEHMADFEIGQKTP